MIQLRTRYAKLIKRNPALFDERYSILCVGATDGEPSKILRRPVDFCLPEQLNVYSENQFDYVICTDVLEFLTIEDRANALREILRIAKRKVIISFYSGEAAMLAEKSYAVQLKNASLSIPEEIKERLKSGFPTLSQITHDIQSAGFSFDIIGNESMLQHYAAFLLDQHFAPAIELLALFSAKTVIEAPIADNEWDLYYSFLLSIDPNSKLKDGRKISSFKFSKAPAEPNLKLYSIFHAPISLDHFGEITPLAVGKQAETANNSPCINDILTDGSRLNNHRWSELSGIYKIWKEAPSAYVGFCHYRRVFDLRFNHPSDERSLRIPLHSFPPESAVFGDKFLSALDENTIITPSPQVLTNPSLFDQYHFNHKITDLCLVLNILQEHFPELSKATSVIYESRELYSNNMFITSWQNFDELCQIWFKVLSIFEGLISNDGQNRYQSRDISFLAERLFTVWMHYKKTQGAKIMHIPFFHIDYPGFDALQWSTTA